MFDYSHALGDLDSLEPGAVTSAVTWRLRVPSPVKIDIYIGVRVIGAVASDE